MRNVVIDLGNLEYLYSDTINAFIASNRHMLEVSGRIAILTEHPKVQDILKRAGLDNIMRIYRSEAEMIADSKEILRQTSSYRIEELQKISGQSPLVEPPPPKTEFDEFKMEMGQRLGSKIENNELPQYQLGLPTDSPASSGQPPANPQGYDMSGRVSPEPPVQGHPQNPQQGFGSQAGLNPGLGIGGNQGDPNYRSNPQGYGTGMPLSYQPPGMAPPGSPSTGNPFPVNQPPQHIQPGGFDYPTVQLPISQFTQPGSTSQNTQPPHYPPQSGGPGTGYRPDPYGQNMNRGDAEAEEEYFDPRQRKPSMERMRSPSARKQSSRRVGGREFSTTDDAVSTPPGAYGNEQVSQYASEQPGIASSYTSSAPLIEESRSPLKWIIVLVLFFMGAGGVFLYLSSSQPQPELSKAESQPAVPSQPETPIPEIMPPPAAAPEVATTPSAPSVESKPSTSQSEPVKNVVKPAEPEPKPKAKPKPKPEQFAAREEPVVQRPVTRASDKSLRITSNPSGAEVLINFSKKGVTPLDVDLLNNSNKIIVRMSGYKRFETTLPSDHGKTELAVNLEGEGGAPVASTPAPAPIKEESVPTRVSEMPEPEPPAVVERAVPTPPPPVAKPKPSFTPGSGPMGIIFLSSSPARADIIVNGTNTGKKTPSKVELPSGSHRIEMSKSGQTASVEQVVNEGKNKALHLNLR